MANPRPVPLSTLGSWSSLEEGFEDLNLSVCGDAWAAVFHFKLQSITAAGSSASRLRTGPQLHIALLREFDRIAQQVEQYLAQLFRHPPAHIVGSSVSSSRLNAQTFAFGSRPDHLPDILQQLHDVKCFQLQLDVSCLYSGKTQYLVDHAQQVLAAAIDDAQHFMLLRVEIPHHGQGGE